MKTKRTGYDYGECHLCGGRLTARRVTQEFWVKGRLIVVDGVPAGVCPQCGSKVVRGAVGQRVAALLENSARLSRARKINVPVVHFTRESA